MKPTLEDRLIDAVYSESVRKSYRALPSKQIGAAFRTIVRNSRKLVDLEVSKHDYREHEAKCSKLFMKYVDAGWKGKLPESADKIKSLELDGNFLQGMKFAFNLVKDKTDLSELMIGPLYFHSYGGTIYLFQGSEEDIIARLKKGQQDIRELMRSASIVNG